MTTGNRVLIFLLDIVFRLLYSVGMFSCCEKMRMRGPRAPILKSGQALQVGGSTASLLREGYERQGTMAKGSRKAGEDAQQRVPTKAQRGERNVPFHETNPFCFRGVFDVSFVSTVFYVVCSGVCKWVRSGETNPFGGGL